MEQRRENENISGDRIIVENYFGRQPALWAIAANKYRWSESLYDDIFKLTIALTNLHIRCYPLRDADGQTYERYRKRLKEIAECTVAKRKRAQASYRKRRRRRIERELRGIDMEEGAGELLEEDEESLSC